MRKLGGQKVKILIFDGANLIQVPDPDTDFRQSLKDNSEQLELLITRTHELRLRNELMEDDLEDEEQDVYEALCEGIYYLKQVRNELYCGI